MTPADDSETWSPDLAARSPDLAARSPDLAARSPDLAARSAPAFSPDTTPPARRRPPLTPPKQGTPEPIAALNRVRIQEYALSWAEREPLVDIRRHCPDVVINARVCPYLRRTVADMVNRAQASLEPGCKLRVGSAMRTLSAQKGGWDSYYQKLREQHPDWPLSALRRATNKYFAPYDVKAPPGHCTGGAIDVGLLDAEGNSLDMIAPTEGWQAAYTWSDKIGPEAKANRMRMVEAMLGAGFSNCRDEYWHYSYGDSAWAARVGEPECPYGWTYPPIAIEMEAVATAGETGPGAGTEAAGADRPFVKIAEADVETARDSQGRPLSASAVITSANGAEVFAADNDGPRVGETNAEPSFLTGRVGVFWANGVPVTLRLGDGRVASNRPVTFYLGDDSDTPTWRPLLESEVERLADGFQLRFAPTSDRVFLVDRLPAPPPDKDEPSGA